MKKNFIAPALGRIVLRNLKSSEVTESGLFLPGGAQTIGALAEVVAVCGEYETDYGLKGPMYALGETVVIGKYQGVDVEIGRDTYIVLQETDILGKLVEVEDASAESK